VHNEDEPFAPLGVYGQTKAAADAIVSAVPQHYVIRTSWVIGDGANFVRTMASLAGRGIDPTVVDDQFGRLSFADDIASGIVHLVTNSAPYGTYNLSNGGPVQTWADIAKRVYELTGNDPARVTGVSTAEYFAGKFVAPRPVHSALNLSKITSVGFSPRDGDEALVRYLRD
jgi:dTDP-4-dehydrorhamnose reductase